MKSIACTALALALATGAMAQPLRDPFARPATPAIVPAEAATEPAQPELVLQLRAVMVGPGRSLANINGQILAVGEWFGDYQLIKVDERAVMLARRGVKSVLALDEASRK